MRVYHYTSIESLAMILSNRMIRFSRLDTVDDPDEFAFENKSGIDIAKFIYVSCWSKNSNESIPLWKIYGNNEKGIRISLDEDMFKMTYKEIEKNGRQMPFILDDDFFKDKDFIASLPYTNNNQEQCFFEKVNCVDDPKSEMKNEYIKTGKKFGTDIGKIGICKNQDWKFLNEYRFRICVAPKKNYKDIVTPFEVAFRDNIPYNKNYVDLPLNDSFNDIEITLGPKTGEAEEVIVKALMKRYLGREDCNYSVFKGLV